MEHFMNAICTAMMKNNRTRYRDRRAHYATSNRQCLRDQYWKIKGIEEDNPPDLVGKLKMFVGDAIDKAIAQFFYRRLSYFGYHLRDDQVPVGSSNPDWDGYLDGLIDRREGDEFTNSFVLEVKTKSGYGADLFYDKPEPDESYMTQLGLYLKDLSEKGETNEGYFLYILLSDKHFGTMVLVHCTYDKDKQTITADKYLTSEGNRGHLASVCSIREALTRWTTLDKAVDDNKEPEGEYRYKVVITRELASDLTDAKLYGIAKGNRVEGDWQVKYSGYKHRQIKADGLTLGHTDEERLICLQEYMRRHPRSKIWHEVRPTLNIKEQNNE